MRLCLKNDLTPAFHVKSSHPICLFQRCMTVCVNITDLPSFLTGKTLSLDRVCTNVRLTAFILEPLAGVFCPSSVRVYKLWLKTFLSCSNFRSRLKIRLGKLRTFLVYLSTATCNTCRDVEAKCHAFYTPALDSGERSDLHSGKGFVLFG